MTTISKKPTSSTLVEHSNNQCHNNDAQTHSSVASHTMIEPDDVTESASSSAESPLSSREGGFTLNSIFSPHISLVLENAGSVARDHLANERTWLAYVRTSLAIAGTGVALVQLFAIGTSTTSSQDGNRLSLKRFARPLGATTVLIGFCILCIGVYRYFIIQKAMTQGKFPVARNMVIAVSGILAALSAVIFAILKALPR